MEMGGPHDEVVFGSFDQVEQHLNTLLGTIEKRGMMTPSEKKALQKVEQQLPLYPDVDKRRREALHGKIKTLFREYLTYHNP